MKNVRRWNPKTGDHQVFADSADAPKDWLDRHPDTPVDGEVVTHKRVPATSVSVDVAEKAAIERVTEQENTVSMTRKEIRTALGEGGIAYDKTDSTENLYVLLTAKVKEVLTEAKIEFDPAADTKTLLGLLPPSE